MKPLAGGVIPGSERDPGAGRAALVLACPWELAGPESPAVSRTPVRSREGVCLLAWTRGRRRVRVHGGGRAWAWARALGERACLPSSPQHTLAPGLGEARGTGQAGRPSGAGRAGGSLSLTCPRAPSTCPRSPGRPRTAPDGRSVLQVLLRGTQALRPPQTAGRQARLLRDAPLDPGASERVGLPGPQWPWAAGSRPLAPSGHAGQRGRGRGREGGKEGARRPRTIATCCLRVSGKELFKSPFPRVWFVRGEEWGTQGVACTHSAFVCRCRSALANPSPSGQAALQCPPR